VGREKFSCSGCSKACDHDVRKPGHAERALFLHESEFDDPDEASPDVGESTGIQTGERRHNGMQTFTARRAAAVTLRRFSRLRRMANGRAGSNRLSVDDWIQTGYAIVADAGIEALKIDRLCSRLGVTKGSFYWHFKDMAGYRAALVESWAELRDRDRSHFGELGHLTPRERLAQMMASLLGERQWALERAMREWARTDPAVAESVRAADRRVLAAVRQAFLDAGFDGDDAEMRANATFAAGIGFLHFSDGPPSARLTEQRVRFLDLMLTD